MTVHIGFVLDMSGSMAGIHQATVEGTTEYLRGMKREQPDAHLTLTVFDDVIETWVEDKPLRDVRVASTLKRYQPRNRTALLDAVGSTINSLKKASVERVAPGMPLQNKVILVVMTDGYENASSKWTVGQLSDKVRKLTKRGNWTFVYLGANVDAWTVARSMGIADGNTMSYSSTDVSTRSAMVNTAKATAYRSRSPVGQSASFFEDAGVEQDVREEDDPLKQSAPAPS